LGIAMFATRTDFGAAAHRVPSRVCPFNRRFLCHVFALSSLKKFSPLLKGHARKKTTSTLPDRYLSEPAFPQSWCFDG
jgi:hypothetical protein